MSAEVFDGKKTAQTICSQLAEKIAKIRAESETAPKLAVVLVGKDPASEIYIKAKQRACQQTGIASQVFRMAEDIGEPEVLCLIEELNRDRTVHAVLVQFPLPEHISQEKVMTAISPVKDVDGLNPVNLGKLLLGDEGLAPCTAKAVVKILEQARIDVAGKNVVVVNDSPLVGKPLFLMLLQRGATVEICHQQTKDLAEHTQRADLVVSAVGLAELIKADMIKQAAVVIDVGISRVNGRIQGDVDFANVKNKASLITPVPGGVGPMTVAMLMENTLNCCLMQKRSLNDTRDKQ